MPYRYCTHTHIFYIILCMTMFRHGKDRWCRTVGISVKLFLFCWRSSLPFIQFVHFSLISLSVHNNNNRCFLVFLGKSFSRLKRINFRNRINYESSEAYVYDAASYRHILLHPSLITTKIYKIFFYEICFVEACRRHRTCACLCLWDCGWDKSSNFEYSKIVLMWAQQTQYIARWTLSFDFNHDAQVLCTMNELHVFKFIAFQCKFRIYRF